MYSTIVVRMVKITFSFSSPLLPFFFIPSFISLDLSQLIPFSFSSN